MSTIRPKKMPNVGQWPAENDLPSVACQAAIELDNLLIGRSTETSSVSHLALLISTSIPEESDPASSNWLLDPTAVVVVSRALSDASTKQPLKSVKELVREAGELVNRFEQLAADPSDFKQKRSSELSEMRSFCLALSRQASASRKSPIEMIPEHPFRR